MPISGMEQAMGLIALLQETGIAAPFFHSGISPESKACFRIIRSNPSPSTALANGVST